MKNFYQSYQGRRGFIVEGGKSLNKQNLSLLKDEITFSVNGIYRHPSFVPTFYLVEDPLFAKENMEDIRAFKGPIKFLGKYLSPLFGAMEDTFWMNVYYEYAPYPGFPHFSKNVEEMLWVGGTATYLCLQLAYYMGLQTVYLIGFDHHYTIPENIQKEENVFTFVGDDPNHFHPEYLGKNKRMVDPKLDRMELAYKKALEVYEREGRKIFNATEGGNLDLFPRADFSNLFIPSNITAVESILA
jgi:hypothetical protein